MKKHVFTGSGVAIITPFTASGIDFDKLGELCEFHISSGTDAIVVCGTTGEASTMPDSEHLSVIEYAVRKVAGRVPLIAGTGSNDTAHAVKLAFQAESLGADALLCVTPYYNRASQQGLFLHFEAVAKSVKIPIILYNVPARTTVNINPGTIKRLSEISNIVAIKECNLSQVPDTLHLCGDNISIYSGEDGQVVPILAFGGIGVISVIANILPSQIHDMVKAYFDGDIERSRQIQIKYMPLIRALFSDVNPIPIKDAMNFLGYSVGLCRMPLCEMSEPMSAELHELIRENGVERWNR